MPALTKAQLAAVKPARSHAPVKVPTPELGEGAYVCVRKWSGRDRQMWELAAAERSDNEQELARVEGRKWDWKRVHEFSMARGCVLSLCDDAGAPLYEGSEDDVAWFAELPGDVQSRIFKVTKRVNGLAPEDIEAIVKNSAGGPGSELSSGSPSESAASTPTTSVAS